MDINPEDLSAQEIYKVMMGSIVPRPIAWVSTISDAGVTNLAPFSYFYGVCCDPMSILFCPATPNSGAGKKDTLRNIEEVPEFVVNVVTEDNVKDANSTAMELPPEQSELDYFDIESVASKMVRPPRVLNTRIAFECELDRIIEVNSGPGGGGSGHWSSCLYAY